MIPRDDDLVSELELVQKSEEIIKVLVSPLVGEVAGMDENVPWKWKKLVHGLVVAVVVRNSHTLNDFACTGV